MEATSTTRKGKLLDGSDPVDIRAVRAGRAQSGAIRQNGCPAGSMKTMKSSGDGACPPGGRRAPAPAPAPRRSRRHRSRCASAGDAPRRATSAARDRARAGTPAWCRWCCRDDPVAIVALDLEARDAAVEGGEGMRIGAVDGDQRERADGIHGRDPTQRARRGSLGGRLEVVAVDRRRRVGEGQLAHVRPSGSGGCARAAPRSRR